MTAQRPDARGSGLCGINIGAGLSPAQWQQHLDLRVDGDRFLEPVALDSYSVDRLFVGRGRYRRPVDLVAIRIDRPRRV